MQEWCSPEERLPNLRLTSVDTFGASCGRFKGLVIKQIQEQVQTLDSSLALRCTPKTATQWGRRLVCAQGSSKKLVNLP
jgi:hypothetical protein